MFLFCRRTEKAFWHKDTSKLFFPVRDIPLQFINLKLIFSAPIGQIYPILYKHYNGFTIYHNPTFGSRQIFSGELLVIKISIFGFFWRANDIFRNANVSRLIDEAPFSRAACCDISVPIVLFGLLLSKKAEIFEFFLKRFDILYCPLRYFNGTQIFHKLICRIPLFFADLHWLGHQWPGPNFLADECFPPASFWRKYWKTKILSEGTCYFFTILRPNILLIAYQKWFGDRLWTFSCLQLLAVSFLIFPIFWPKIFKPKKDFLKNVSHYLKLTRSTCLEVMYITLIELQFQQSVWQRVSKQVWFLSDLFLWNFCRNLSNFRFL